jgi:hypothetical protein
MVQETSPQASLQVAGCSDEQPAFCFHHLDCDYLHLQPQPRPIRGQLGPAVTVGASYMRPTCWVNSASSPMMAARTMEGAAPTCKVWTAMPMPAANAPHQQATEQDGKEPGADGRI